MEPAWNKLRIKDKDFYHRLEVSTDGYKLLLTDLVRLYVEELFGEDKILQRCDQLNPVVEVTDATDLLVELGRIFQSAGSQLDFEAKSRKLSVIGQLYNCPFNWSFNLSEASPEELHREVTLPSLAALSRLAQSQKILVDLIKAKDEEIRDFEEGGAALSRKSLKTKPFSDDLIQDVGLKQDFKDIVASVEFAKLSDVTSDADVEDVGNAGHVAATQSSSRSPVKPSQETGKKRVKPSAAINPIVSSKQARTGFSQQTQSQKTLPANVKDRLKKL